MRRSGANRRQRRVDIDMMGGQVTGVELTGGLGLSESGSLHPRPQLARRRWTDLSGTWGFAYDDDRVGLDEGWAERAEVYTRRIRVPYPRSLRRAGSRTRASIRWSGIGGRSTRASHPENASCCTSARSTTGRPCGSTAGTPSTTRGGHTPFCADVTALLVDGEEQVVTVRAEDLPDDLTQPRGKQDWQERPHSVWYERTTGIWQPVWLEPVRARCRSVDGNAQRLRLRSGRADPAHPGVDRGGRPRCRIAGGDRLGAVQRELGGAPAARRRRPAARRARALFAHQGT